MIYRTDGVTCSQLDRDGLSRMAALMAAAFMEHANWKGLIPDADRRARALRALFGFMGAVVNRHGHVVVLVEDGREVGYVTFMENRDAEQVSFRRVLRCGGLGDALRFLVALRPSELAGMASFGAAARRGHGGEGGGGDPDPRGLHLYTAAIDPDLKGRGLMKRAFAWMEGIFGQAGFASYSLETTDPANLPVYRRFGMEPVGSSALPGRGRTVWFFRKALGGGHFDSPASP